MTTIPRVVLVGCGEVATLGHLPALATLREANVIDIGGVCDVDDGRAAQVAATFGVARWGTDWRRVADAAGADTLVVTVPPGPNADIAAEAVEQGLHVMCEKPPGRNVRQAERLRSAAELRPDRVTMVAFNRRHAPLYVRAIDASRGIGQPHSFYARFSRAAMGAEPSNTLEDWITSDSSHAIDLAIATMGYPESIAVTRRTVGGGAANAWTLQLQTPHGAAVLVLDFAAGHRVEKFEWVGPGYDVALDMPDRGVWSQASGPAQEWRVAEIAGGGEFPRAYGFVGQHERFAAAVSGRGTRPEADFRYAADFMALVAAILDTEDGHASRRVGTAPAARILRSEAAATLNGRHAAPSERPVVRVLQSPASQMRYFAMDRLARVAERCDLRLASATGDTAGDIVEADVLFIGWGAPTLSAAQLAKAERLKLVVVLGASVHWAVDAGELRRRGIALCNTADAIARSVAEHCLMLSLAGLRRLSALDREIHAGGWPPHGGGVLSRRNLLRYARRLPLPGAVRRAGRPVAARVLGAVGGPAAYRDLRGQTVGLVGWGHTARRFAELLQPFDCTLLVCSDHVDGATLEPLNARVASLGEVLGSARVISLHKGLTDRTRGLLDAGKLDLVRRGSVLVNVARGALIEEAALVDRARRGDIVIALDVFHDEPLPRRHPLRRHASVILTPHSASSTVECARRVGAQALDALETWLDGRQVETLAPERLAAMT